MEYELTCCICLDLYKEPVTLPCSHSLCRGCLNTVANAAGDPLFLRPFNCPTCRFNVQRQHFIELKENKLLSSIVNAYRRDKDMTGSVPQMVCYVHPTEQLLLYCQSCKKAVCSYCVTEVHYKYSHRVSYIEHLIEDEKESVGKLLKEADRSLQEKRAKLIKQKNAVQNEKEVAEQVCLSLMNQLKARFAKIKSDYIQNIDATVRELNVTEKAIESRSSEFRVFAAAFDSMTYKPDRHLFYKKLMNLGKELLTFSLSVSMNSSLLVEERQLPNFAISSIESVREAIESLDLVVSNKAVEQERNLEELIEQGLEHENVRAVFSRAMKKWETTNGQKSEQDAGIQHPETVSCVTNPASNLTAGNSTASSAATSDVEQASSAEGSVPATSSSAIALAPEASLVVSSESAQPSELCEKLKTTLVDFFNLRQQKEVCNAGEPSFSDLNPSQLPMQLPSNSSSLISQPQQTLTSKQGPSTSLLSSSSNPLPVTSPQSRFSTAVSSLNTEQSNRNEELSVTFAQPRFLTAVSSLNFGQSYRNPEPVTSKSNTASSRSNRSQVPKSARFKQSESSQSVTSSVLSSAQSVPPEASASMLTASMVTFMAAPAFSVGVSGEERERSPKKAVRRAARKF